MTLTRAGIIESLYSACGYSRQKSTALLESTLEIIKKTLESGEDVLISGFGKFSVKDSNGRTGRNHAAGNYVPVEAGRVVTFRCSSVLSEKVNGEG